MLKHHVASVLIYVTLAFTHLFHFSTATVCDFKHFPHSPFWQPVYCTKSYVILFAVSYILTYEATAHWPLRTSVQYLDSSNNSGVVPPAIWYVLRYLIVKNFRRDSLQDMSITILNKTTKKSATWLWVAAEHSIGLHFLPNR